MQESIKALNGFGTDIFAGIPVTDYEASLAWYERLFGCAPSFFPNGAEAVWQLAEHQWAYIVADPKRAGHSIQNIMGNDLDALVTRLAERGMHFDKEELPADNTRKVIYRDPDGNEIGFISVSN